jgi:hypothetical protein
MPLDPAFGFAMVGFFFEIFDCCVLILFSRLLYK